MNRMGRIADFLGGGRMMRPRRSMDYDLSGELGPSILRSMEDIRGKREAEATASEAQQKAMNEVVKWIAEYSRQNQDVTPSTLNLLGDFMSGGRLPEKDNPVNFLAEDVRSRGIRKKQETEGKDFEDKFKRLESAIGMMGKGGESSQSIMNLVNPYLAGSSEVDMQNLVGGITGTAKGERLMKETEANLSGRRQNLEENKFKRMQARDVVMDERWGKLTQAQQANILQRSLDDAVEAGDMEAVKETWGQLKQLGLTPSGMPELKTGGSLDAMSKKSYEAQKAVFQSNGKGDWKEQMQAHIAELKARGTRISQARSMAFEKLLSAEIGNGGY